MRSRPAPGSVRLSLTGLLEVDGACDRFEAAVRAGEEPEIAGFLDDAPAALRTPLLRELLILELGARLDRGERPAAGDYHARFPEDGAVIDEVFAQVGLAATMAGANPNANANANAVPDRDRTEIHAEVAAALRSAGYEVLGELGRGGMGIVYLARQVTLHRLCALKMIRDGAHADPETAIRFLAEAETIARLRHPHIVEIHHLGQAGGLPFVALEYLAGGSLDQALDGTPWPAAKAVALLIVLTGALVEAHRLGIVHRDLKPGNVLLTADGVPKIGDFGLAKSLVFDSQLTRTGLVVGSPCYMAPEQAEGRADEVGPATDLYSLGAILYELVTGRPPFKAATAIQTLDLVRSQEPIPPRQMQPDLPRDLETICLTCLQKDPRRRYARAEDLAEDLERFLHGRPILARPTGAAEHAWKWARRHPGVAILSVALVAVTALAFALIAWQWQRAETRARAEAIAHNEARQARREAIQGQAQLALNHGLDLCERTEIGRGLLWLARSLELAAEAQSGEIDRALRINLADWSSRFSRPEVRARHPAPLRDLAFRPDGGRLVSAGEDGTLRTWETTTWHEVDATPGPIAGPIAWNPVDPSLLVAFDREGRGLVWDVDRRERQGPLLEHPSPTTVCALAFSPDGRTLFTSGSDGTARRWDLAARRPVGEPLRHGEGFTTLALGPDGRTLVTGGEDGRLVRWETATGRFLDALRLDSPVRTVAFGRDGQAIVAGTQGGRLSVWSPDRERVSDLPPQGAAVTSLATSPDGTLFATATEGGTVRLWDTTTLRPTGQTSKLRSAVRCLAFRPDGRTLAIGQDDGTIRICALPRPTTIGRPFDAGGPVLAVTFSRDGARILSGSRRGLACRDLAGRPVWSSPGPADPGDPVESTAVSPDGRIVAAAHSIAAGGRAAYRVTLRDAEGGAFLRESPDLADPPAALAFSPDGQRLLTWGRGPRSALLWDVASLRTGRPVFRSLEAATHQAAFRRDGRTLVLGGRDGRARLWDLARDAEVILDRSPRHAYPITAVAFDPYHPRIVTGCHAGTLRLWDETSGVLLNDVRGNAGEIVAVAFSPDGATLLTASLDATARFWDIQSGRQLGPPLHHPDAVLCAAFHPDGRSVATGSKDGTVRRWEAPLAPRPGRPDQIRHWVEAETGLTLDDRVGGIRTLAELQPSPDR